MVLGLAMLIFIVGLNLLGVFEFGMSFMGAGSSLAAKQGSVGAYFTGVLAAIVGAPCVGPLLAASLGAVVNQPAWVVILFLLIMGAGLASPFVVLSFVPRYAQLLPKPGAWMETLKQVLAFPMFLTAVWLLWVFAGQRGMDAATIALVCAVAIGFALWLIGRNTSGKKSQFVGWGVFLLALITPFSLTANATNSQSLQVANENAGFETAAWSAEKVFELRAQSKPVFIDFTARWCVTCQVNKRVALQSSAVKEAFAENDVVFLTADWTNRDPEIAQELAKHKRAGVPLYLYYAPGAEEPEILPQLLTPGMVVDVVTGRS
jgi:thiol:disulfide interchange protein DsbD